MPGGSPGGSTASSPTSTSRAPASNVARSPSPRRIPPPSPPAPRPEGGLAALRLQRDEGVVAGDEEPAAVGDERRVAGGGDREVLLVGVDVEADGLAGGEARGEDLVGDDGRGAGDRAADVVVPALLAAVGVERVEGAVFGADVDGFRRPRHLRDGGGA